MFHRRVKSSRGIYERAVLEEDIVGSIRAFLEAHGAFVIRVVERVPRCYRCGCWLGASEGGIPDLAGWFRPNSAANPSDRPVHFFIEVKRPTKSRRRPKQEAFIERATGDNVIAFFASKLEDVKTVLECVGGLRLAKL
jgi:hypothetical protein